MARPMILLSNDDGFQAQGLRFAREALAEVADVVVCAPFSEQSATSHSISLTTPLRLIEHEKAVFSVDGTPADCVYVALCAGRRVLPKPPDLVVSGINHGLNLGADVFYSGTVAAAREAALRGFRALALSANPRADMKAAAGVAKRLVEGLLRQSDPQADGGVLLNVNFPPGDSWVVRGTHLGTRRYEDAAEFRTDPRGAEYLWLGGAGVSHEGEDGSDTAAHDEGQVGVTPLSLQMWNSEGQPLADRLAASVGRVEP